MKIAMGLLSVVSALIGVTSVQSTEFVVINESDQDVFVAVVFHRPAGTADSIAFDSWPNAWMHEGWTVVRPGERATAYKGNNGRIYVRMNKKDGTVLKPGKFYREISAAITNERFRLERVIPSNHMNLRYGPKLESRKSGKNADEVEMKIVDGFYEMDTATNFTVK